jgi:uncharacterized protein (TIGR02452 family)
MTEQRKITAQETLKIQQQGFYTVNSRLMDISAGQRHSEVASRLITPAEGKRLAESLPPPENLSGASYEVRNNSTVQAIIDASHSGKAVAALNFASAKNPGGGFLNGAMAQEEALASSGGLYNTQIRHRAYYDNNRSCGTMIYTDHAIYSPDVVFFRDAAFNLTETPVTASILTLPAVNMGQVQAKGEDVVRAKAVMKDRMRLCLAILAHERNKVIILGAYGCGVFGNDANEVAGWWKELLFDEGYGGYFEKVIFAVLDKPGGESITTFERTFGHKPSA